MKGMTHADPNGPQRKQVAPISNSSKKSSAAKRSKPGGCKRYMGYK